MTDQAPTISVIVPTYNRRERLHRTLSGLAQQQLDGVTFETIVVSDGSTDDTDEYLESSSVPIDVVALRQENSGPAAARTRGIRAARGELCVFIDDDIVPDPRLLVSHYEAHQESSGSLVTIGPMLTPTDAKLNPWVDWEQRMLYKQYDALRDKSMQTTSRQFYTGNTAIRREHLVAAGGFDESFLEPRTSSSRTASPRQASSSRSSTLPSVSTMPSVRSTHGGGTRSNMAATMSPSLCVAGNRGCCRSSRGSSMLDTSWFAG